ncbi:hypothetical protein [Actinoplanes sp. NPDC051494]|uniref:hypothetical protein n=1 Tax=Actinoplanes sp. NPDC051494 TaxID=3363907 RepID=UPI0037A22E2D
MRAHEHPAAPVPRHDTVLPRADRADRAPLTPQAVLALQRAAGNAATTAALPVIQRAVGFEFEAQWKVRRQDGTAPEVHEAPARRYDEQHGTKLLEMVASPAAASRMALWFPGHTEELTHLAAGSPLVERGEGAPMPTPAGVDWLETARRLDSHGYRRATLEANVTRFLGGELAEPPLPGVSLDKHERIADGDRYRLEADTSPSGGSNLEWVTEPLDTRAQVATVMNAITTMAGGMEQRRTDREIPAPELTPPGHAGLVIHPDGRPLDFSPQATAGLALDRIAAMAEHLTTPGSADGQEYFRENTMRRSVAGARTRVDAAHPGDPGRDALIGLVTLLGNYLNAADGIQSGGNSKSIAGGLMSRTDFAHNFQLLPEPLRTRYQAAPAAFAQLVTGSADNSDPVFPLEVERGAAGARSRTRIRLTRGDWLTGIARGQDLLKNHANFTDTQRTGLSAEHAEDSKAVHDSLGKLGTVPDLVGPEAARVIAVVAEFRRMRDGKVTADLVPFALRLFDLVETVNAGLPLGDVSSARTTTRLGPGLLTRLGDLLLGCCRGAGHDG